MLSKLNSSSVSFDNLLAVVVLDRRDTLAHRALRDVHACRSFLHCARLRELHERFEILNQLKQPVLNKSGEIVRNYVLDSKNVAWGSTVQALLSLVITKFAN